MISNVDCDSFLVAWTIGDHQFDPDLCFLVKDGAGELVAHAQCWTVPFVKDLAVRKEVQRRGIGYQLLLHVFHVFRARGADHIDLKVETENLGARRLHERAGMIVIDT